MVDKEDPSLSFSQSIESFSQSISKNLTPRKVKKLLEDREKAKVVIKNIKHVMKEQGEHIKKQQNEYKKAISTLETQSFTTRFHAVAFKLELDAMRLISIRRKFDTLDLKLNFQKLIKNTVLAKRQEEAQIKASLSLYKSACTGIWSVIKNKSYEYLSQSFQALRLGPKPKASKNLKSRLEALKQERKKLRSQLRGSSKGQDDSQALQDSIEENKQLKEKLTSTEESVATFIREMTSLLEKHEPPGFRIPDAESPRPGLKVKKGKRPKARVPLISPERNEMARKHKNIKLQFD
ncbi:unnamed protein product [Blepharisma stoltei]|uniref:Uncharacterized protein n=1 Tax=Blepharisma stoltei TaxID=1481888 RepID=A0AAU9IWT1_9CILI|nr:unnamed protein product [Blepharisma stoltei]